MTEKLQEYSIQISTPDQFTPPEDRLGRSDHTWHGAAILWHGSIDPNIECIDNTHDRFTGIKLKFSGANLLAISAYLPTSGKDDDFLSCLGQLSCFITDNIVNIDTVLIGMDSNCSEKSTPRRIRGFQQFCHDNKLLKICHSEPTFHHSNGLSSSNIDFFLISERSADNLYNISSQCNQDHPQNFSSHDPVSATLRVPCADLGGNRAEKYGHTYTDFTQPRVLWSQSNLCQYQDAAAKILSDFEAFLPTPEFIPLKCQLYSDLLVKAAELSLASKPSKPEKKAGTHPQVHQAWQRLQKSHRVWKKEGKSKALNSTSFTLYKQARANFQQVRRYRLNLKNIKCNNLLMNSHVNDKNQYFKIIKNLRGSKERQRLTELHTPEGVYYGKDTLEGFARDAELLAESIGESKEFDNKFYQLCKEDNL